MSCTFSEWYLHNVDAPMKLLNCLFQGMVQWFCLPMFSHAHTKGDTPHTKGDTPHTKGDTPEREIHQLKKALNAAGRARFRTLIGLQGFIPVTQISYVRAHLTGHISTKPYTQTNKQTKHHVLVSFHWMKLYRLLFVETMALILFSSCLCSEGFTRCQ